MTAEALRKELQQALRAEAAQYHPVQLTVSDVKAEEGLLILQPTPAAQADWVGGRVIGYRDGVVAWDGQVMHVDPERGEVILSSRAAPEGALEWVFKPFDFSEALGATAASTNSRFENALNWVCDGGDGLPKASSSIDEPWNAEWGLLWGPPGTGKTETLARRIARDVTGSRSRRLLLVAPTNNAVDELTHRVCTFLKDDLFRVMRCGASVRSRLAKEFPACVSYDDALARAEELQALEKTLQKLEASHAPDTEIARARAAVAAASQTADATMTSVKRDEVQIIAITVHRALRLANQLAGEEPRFDKLILDEGGMVSRAAAAALAPLARSMLVAGDPKQLGPISRVSDGAVSGAQKWLRLSPLSHLRDARKLERSNVHLLRTQHRMHPHISKVVSEFQYDGQLLDGPRPAELLTEKARGGLPDARAIWVVLDESGASERALTHERAGTGRGYQRRFSANLLTEIARTLFDGSQKLLAATPYRAQAMLLNRLNVAPNFTASTIHRQQGSEVDAVFIDTVAAGKPFPPLELCALLNVAASRARRHLLVVSSRAEAQLIPEKFFSSLFPMRWRDGRLEPVDVKLRRRAPMPRQVLTLGSNIDNAKSMSALFTEAQVKLFERHFGDGHYLVRGVAGSGKTFVLANWAARVLAEHRADRVLISFFNKSLAPLQEQHLKAALERQGLDVDTHFSRARICHVDELHSDEQFDAVFVDEAQDMPAQKLRKLFLTSRERLTDGGRRLRRFFLFMDDAQNVYGVKPIDDFKAELHHDLDFKGRVQVMKESFRSPRDLLDLAFNVVLDPHDEHHVAQPGMKEFLKENELVKAGLLHKPTALNGQLYRVDFTERGGALPVVITADDKKHARDEMVRVVKRLIDIEQVKPRDILVVSPSAPINWAEALWKKDVSAKAFGGVNGHDLSEFPVGDFDFVRCTTLYSCKGHECPVVLFCGVDQLDTFEKEGADARTTERQRRALFYVGATRATHRQYFIGVNSRFMRVAKHYVEALSRY